MFNTRFALTFQPGVPSRSAMVCVLLINSSNGPQLLAMQVGYAIFNVIMAVAAVKKSVINQSFRSYVGTACLARSNVYVPGTYSRVSFYGETTDLACMTCMKYGPRRSFLPVY